MPGVLSSDGAFTTTALSSSPQRRSAAWPRCRDCGLLEADIDKLDAVAGDKVKLTSPSGELVVELESDPAVPNGVAMLQFNAAPIYEQERLGPDRP